MVWNGVDVSTITMRDVISDIIGERTYRNIHFRKPEKLSDDAVFEVIVNYGDDTIEIIEIPLTTITAVTHGKRK